MYMKKHSWYKKGIKINFGGIEMKENTKLMITNEGYSINLNLGIDVKMNLQDLTVGLIV